MSLAPERQHAPTRRVLDAIVERIGQVVLGKERQARLALACLLARGHLLIEDLPGMGKTTLAQVLAQALGLQFKRVQFTSDLLPADILGVSIYQPDTKSFVFHRGPEPAPFDRHLPAAGVATRPLSIAHRDGLSRPRRRASVTQRPRWA